MEGCSVVLGHPVHFWTAFSSILFRSCLVWQAIIVRIRAGNGSSFFCNHAVVESAGGGVWYYLAMCLYPSNMPEKDLGDRTLSMKHQYIPGFVCSRSKPGTL